MFLLWSVIFSGLMMTLVDGQEIPSVVSEQEGFPLLLENYVTSARPIRDASRPIHIYLFASLSKLRKLDELNEELHTNIHLFAIWYDEYLRWDPGEFPIFYARLPGKNVWTPTLEVSNSLKNSNEDDIPINTKSVSLMYTGMVTSAMTYYLSTSCSIDLSTFPFDNQTCVIHITLNAPNTYYTLETNSQAASVNVTEYDYSDIWRNVQVSQSVVVEWVEFDKDMIPVDVYEITITMERNPRFYVIYLMVPSVLMAFLSVLVFLLPAESGERIGLSITTLLSYTVFLLMVSEFTPRGGSKTPYLLYYITVVTLLSGLNLFLTVIVLRVHSHQPEEKMSCIFRCLAGSSRLKEGTNPWHRAANRLDIILFTLALVLVLIATAVLLYFIAF